MGVTVYCVCIVGMNIGTNERDHPNSSPLNSPGGHGLSLADTQIKQVRERGKERERGGEREIFQGSTYWGVVRLAAH